MAETAVSSALSSCGAPKDGARLLACEPRVLEAVPGEQERQCVEKRQGGRHGAGVVVYLTERVQVVVGKL